MTVVTVAVVTVWIVTSFSKDNLTPQQPMRCSRCSFSRFSRCLPTLIGFILDYFFPQWCGQKQEGRQDQGGREHGPQAWRPAKVSSLFWTHWLLPHWTPGFLVCSCICEPPWPCLLSHCLLAIPIYPCLSPHLPHAPPCRVNKRPYQQGGGWGSSPGWGFQVRTTVQPDSIV